MDGQQISRKVRLPRDADPGQGPAPHGTMDSRLRSQLAVFVMATSNAKGECDASPKGGLPGFVKVLNDRQLFIPDVAGNKLFHGYGNLETNPRVGLVFFIPGHNNTVRINGRVKVIDRDELNDVQLEVSNPDERAEILQGLLLDVEESYSHCPRALKFSNLWDVNLIAKNIARPPVGVKEPGI